MIASYLEPHLVDRIAAAEPGARVVYRPDLVPAPRYAADHVGGAFERTAEKEREWRELLAQADILFDFGQRLSISMAIDGSSCARLSTQ